MMMMKLSLMVTMSMMIMMMMMMNFLSTMTTMMTNTAMMMAVMTMNIIRQTRCAELELRVLKPGTLSPCAPSPVPGSWHKQRKHGKQ